MKKEYKKLFASKDEEFKAVLGQDYVSSILAGSEISQTAIVLSDKRLYQIGKVYDLLGNGVAVTQGKKVVNLEDITGTYSKAISKPMAGLYFMGGGIGSFSAIFAIDDDEVTPIFVLVGIVLFIIGIIITMFSRENIFVVEYSGGYICYPIKFSNEEEMSNFQKIISLEKDKVKNGYSEFKVCPFCAEKIQSKAIVCRYCGRDINP